MNREELLWDQIHRQQEMIDSLLGMCDNLNARIAKMEKKPAKKKKDDWDCPKGLHKFRDQNGWRCSYCLECGIKNKTQ